MAKIDQGILGPFSGKVGTVVGVRWKGQWCMRSYVARICDRRSPLQLEQRSRFTAMIRFAQQAVHAIRLGFKQKADEHNVTEGNWFTHRNTGAFRMSGGSLVVDYERIAVAEGRLAGVAFRQPEFGADGTLRVPFEDDRNLPRTSRQDSVYLFAYLPALGQGLLLPPAVRQSECLTASLPATWQGEEVHLYGFTVGRKGGVSNSCYLGHATLGLPTRRLELNLPLPTIPTRCSTAPTNPVLPTPETPSTSIVSTPKRTAQSTEGQQLSLFGFMETPPPG
ncbi:MAG: hypothetical protein J6I49_01320 [Bacteroidales bacterium]|nr:hypothetical protein [Bacteroidales bacterium]